MGINFIVVKGDDDSFSEDRALRTLDGLIRKCDVVSINLGPISNQAALEEETDIGKFISSSRLGESAKLSIGREACDSGFGEIVKKILKKKRPVIYIERYSEEEYDSMKKMAARMGELDSKLDFLNGSYIDTLVKLYDVMKIFANYTRDRDLNIVKNGFTIHQKIIALYPYLALRQQINYLIILKWLHRIENGLREVPNSSVEALQLKPNESYTIWEDESHKKIIWGNAGLEECKDTLSKAVLSRIYRIAAGNVPSHYLLWPLCNAAVRSIGIKELEALSSRMPQEAGKEEKIAVLGQFFRELGIEMPTKLKDYRRLFDKYSV